MKKNKKIKVICTIITIFFMTVMIFNNFAMAVDPANNISGAMGWSTDTSVTSTAQKIMGTAINVMRIVALGMAIIMLTYVAIKFMSASPEGRAEYKKSITAYVVGAVILFATTGILTVIQKFANANIKG